jgi:hypothetical protein
MGSWDGDGVKDSESEADGGALGQGWEGGGKVRSTMNFTEERRSERSIPRSL